ncbi:MAG: indolepyruvate oxidoreductase subunit beta [Alistipes sp.]|nr:indolepyruvate oxidoreductase subunit beta [Alistipes sp.]
MKKDIILSGVGGQGILSIATIIGDAATRAGLNLKQAEVHGMSQRGGEVESGLRLSDGEIYSDLVPLGSADIILSMEPMEALRYLPFLHEGGFIVTSTTPFRNIEPYPEEAVRAAFDSRERVIALDLDAITRTNAIPQSANVVLLGAAAGVIGILSPEQIEQSIRNIFAAKGEKVVEMNLKAFEIGREYGSRQ